MANIERLYEYWDELYNQYGSALHDVLDESTLVWAISATVVDLDNDEEAVYRKILPLLLAAEDELSAETLDLMEGCYGREE